MQEMVSHFSCLYHLQITYQHRDLWIPGIIEINVSTEMGEELGLGSIISARALFNPVPGKGARSF